MIYLIAFLLYIYISTGVFLSLKLFKHPLGKVIMAIYYGLFWLPLIISGKIKEGVMKE